MNDDRIQTLVLQEFRLSAVDHDGAVSRIVAAAPSGHGPAVPLLTSIDDHRDVATVRALREGELHDPDPDQRAALGPFVSEWQPERQYVARLAARSQSPPTHYRLAVTESGINDEKTDAPAAPHRSAPRGTTNAFDLLWIGRPVATHAGLMVVVGDRDATDVSTSDPPDWPLAMSRQLGVRIYDSQA